MQIITAHAISRDRGTLYETRDCGTLLKHGTREDRGEDIQEA